LNCERPDDGVASGENGMGQGGSRGVFSRGPLSSTSQDQVSTQVVEGRTGKRRFEVVGFIA
jgi:hypothetical protein